MSDPSPARKFAHLSPFSDLVDAARQQGPLFPSTRLDRSKAREILLFTLQDDQPRDVQVMRTWKADGLDGEELSWWVGFGPRTHAWLLKPSGSQGPLPGIVALYDHGHYKFYGKEKIADGPDGPIEAVQPFRDTYYSGRAFANALAREGFAVLIHDTFLWSSRRFPMEAMQDLDLSAADAIGSGLGHGAIDPEILRYHGAAYLHELQLEKYCRLLGTSLAAVIAFEDRVALNCLSARGDVDARRVGCIGFSGGGLRASLLGATAEHPPARVIVGMMATYEELLDRLIAPHTWMLFPAGLSRHGDIPDLAGCAAPAPLLVQNGLNDHMFTPKGMRDADTRIAEYYSRAGATAAYRGEFYESPHCFDRSMQEAAFAWLRTQLAA
jgi:dienelactone hydrolase